MCKRCPIEVPHCVLIVVIADFTLSLLCGLGRIGNVRFGGANDPNSVEGLCWSMFFMLHVITCVFVVVAVMKDDPRLVITWLISCIAKIVVLTTYLVLIILDLAETFRKIWIFFNLIISLYFWICVYFFY